MTIFEALALTVLISIVLGLAFAVWFLVLHIKGRTKAEQEFLKRHEFGSHFKQQRKWESDFLYGDKKNESSVPEAILEATENRRGDE
ncbi:hypothetical protein [Acinetobacter calcoaceticus]|uniref:hypothetical protein n=1 Tax=Acinetobacter calcoaceticus TaxID=471 RepID=UPI0018DCBDD5|nr:hypothetical protein [Acinetobacter calcoaceticus]